MTFLTASPTYGILNSLFTEPLVWCRERGRHMRGDGRLSLPLHLFARLTRIFYTAPCMKYSLANRISILSPFAYNNMIVIAWHHPGNWWGYCATWPIASPPPPLLELRRTWNQSINCLLSFACVTPCGKVWIFRGGVLDCPHLYWAKRTFLVNIR